MGSTRCGQIRIDTVDLVKGKQLSVLRSVHIRGGRSCADKSETNEQLCECSVCASSASVKCNKSSKRNSYSDSTSLAGAAMVQTVNAKCNRPSSGTSNVKKNRNGHRGQKTFEKSQMEDFCLESMWANRLHCLGWSPRAAKQTLHSLAESTLSTNNVYMKKYLVFCKLHNYVTTDTSATAHVADKLCSIADKSERPESSLKISLAALSPFFQALGLKLPTDSRDIHRLVTSFVKTATKKPMVRQKPMPIEAFVQLFDKMESNDKLTLKMLRMKAITLLAIVCMTGPSDLAPKGKNFDPLTNLLNPTFMSVDDVHFENDGSITLHFWAIKNDTNGQGFEINIPPCDDSSCDPISCLKMYIERTEQFRQGDYRPLFLALNAPYKHISADTVANILQDSITAAGLNDQEFSSKSLRPTGSTQAVSIETLPETVMKIGRWKTKKFSSTTMSMVK
ncbi:hypothetical protein DPMN_065210 [Dreissena polymorpha]|uniref:Uncharacterized protein n=1 Tax=Dreissena polymorpha TaxID=45954 RepID=A0A9D4HLR7_DREPO|nr:hypothetical protein DPMN_065210 [Dreissena polymorpha]